MKNKKPILIFGVLLAVTVSTWLLWPMSQSPEPVVEAPRPDQLRIDPSLKPFLPEIEAIKQLAKTEPQKAKEKSNALLEKLPDKYKRYFTLGFNMGMSKINFYGQIVDQYGEPVANASVGFSTGGAGLASGKGIGKLYTDEQGRFEIHSEGGSLTLAGVRAPGIDFQYPKPTHLKNSTFSARTATMYLTGYQHTMGGNNPLWTDTSPGKPYVFTAWRVKEYERVKAGGGQFGFAPDGRIYTLNLAESKRNIKNFLKEGMSDGHIRISCTREPIERVQDRVDWQITITPVDGGILATDDLYLNLAPEAGYQPSLTVDMNSNGVSGSPGSLKNQRYYFTAKNGQAYGSLYMHFRPLTRKDLCVIDIAQYKINLNGSRNLAVKPKY